MRLLIAAGRRGAALRLYDAFAERLDRELGIEPPRSMRALRQSRRPASSGHTEPRESAWRSACASRSVDVLDASLDAMYASADREGRYREGITLLDEAFGAVEDGPLLGRLFSRQAVLYGCIGQLAKARALLEAALPLATCDEEQAFCENRLGGVVFAEGRYALARRYLRASAKRYRAADNSAGLAWTLNVLGHLSIGTTASTKILVDCLARSRRAKDDGRIASTLNSLGKDAYVRGDLARARRFLVKGLSRRRALGHRIGIADSLNNLGNVHIALGQTSHASTVLEEALDIAKRIHARPILAEILIGLATIRDARGEPAHAARLAAAAYHLPGGWRDAKERAERTLKHCATRLAPSTLAGAVASGKTFDL